MQCYNCKFQRCSVTTRLITPTEPLCLPVVALGLTGHHVGGGFCGERLCVHFARPLFHRVGRGSTDAIAVDRNFACRM